MALLAEVIVEEWLNRQGYFTIRGVKVGVHEIDILAVRPTAHSLECRHIEVHASMRPVSYISRVPKAEQKRGRAPNSAKRSACDLQIGVEEWVISKFEAERKRKLMDQLAPGPWSRELVIHKVKSAAEVRMIESKGVSILHLSAIVANLKTGGLPLESAGAADFMDLLHLARSDASAGDLIEAAVFRRGVSNRGDG